MDETQYTLTEHLTELRTRLVRSLLAIFVTTTAALGFAPRLLDYSIRPLTDVLVEQNRVITAVVHEDEAARAALATTVEAMPKARFLEARPDLGSVRALAEESVEARQPIDLLLVSSGALGADGLLATDVLEGLEPAPYVVYLVPSAEAPIVQELMLEGANVVLDPPRKTVLARLVQRAAGAMGKSKSKDALVVLSPLEPFFAYLKIALVIGLFLATPIWLYQVWRFVAPGLYSHEKAFVLPVILSGSLLFIGGGAFAYFFMFPMMFDVIVNQMMPSTLVGTFTVDKYLSLLLRMTVAFGVAFETPLAIALLAMVGIVSPERLRAWRKYAIVMAFVLGALLTPADPISQFAMAIPLILFYELGILLAVLVYRKREQRIAREEALTSAE